MTALLTALSSSCIAQLDVTWAHTVRKPNLDKLLKYLEPTGRFRTYRALLQSAEGPVVPFISMFLTDIVHISQLPDTVPSPSDPNLELISFSKRQRLFVCVSAILKYQSQAYDFEDCESIRAFVERHLATANVKNPDWFWTKAKEVSQLELLTDFNRLDGF
jgi:son of sevenless